MMPYDKYERGFQHLHAGHQKITYEKKKTWLILTLLPYGLLKVIKEHMHVTHGTQMKVIVILTIKYKMKLNKMNNIDNTKNNDNDSYDMATIKQ